MSEDAINMHLEKFPNDFEKFLKKVYYFLKTLAHYQDNLDITNPYYDNIGDIYFLLRIESGESITVGQLSLFEDLDLPDLYNRNIEIPPGYGNDPIVKALIDRIENSNNSFFITGKAGTGKTTFIHYLAQNSKKQILLCAFTGIAAINIGGQTIHSFFRFPLKPLLPNDDEIPIFREFFQKRKIIEKLDTVLIDEVSMLRSDILEALDYSLRNNGGRSDQLFGGKQLILVGDIFQLPPVTDSEDETEN
jgi:hypothetical protein